MEKYNLFGNPSLKLRIIANMDIYGGSFVKALSRCIVLADRNNLKKIEDAFSDYINQYHPKNWSRK